MISSRTTLVSFVVLLLIATVLSFLLVLPYLLSITMGGIISLMLRPLYLKLLAKKFGPKTSAALLTFGVVLLIILPLILLTTLAVKQGIVIGHVLSEDENFSPRGLLAKVSHLPLVNIIFEDAEIFEAKVVEWLQGAGTALTSGVLFVFSQIPAMVLQVVLTAISCFVFLLDGEKFALWMSDKIPLDKDVRRKLSSSFRDTAVSTIWATMAAGGAQSAVMFVAFLILGVPGIFLGTGLTFVFAWIPLVGCSPVWITAAIYLFSKGMVVKTVLMVAFGLGAGLIDNVVRPMVLKGRSKMHPMISLVSIFGGLGLFGILGVFIGPVLASLMISLLSIWPDIRVKFGLLS